LRLEGIARATGRRSDFAKDRTSPAKSTCTYEKAPADFGSGLGQPPGGPGGRRRSASQEICRLNDLLGGTGSITTLPPEYFLLSGDPVREQRGGQPPCRRTRPWRRTPRGAPDANRVQDVPGFDQRRTRRRLSPAINWVPSLNTAYMNQRFERDLRQLSRRFRNGAAIEAPAIPIISLASQPKRVHSGHADSQASRRRDGSKAGDDGESAGCMSSPQPVFIIKGRRRPCQSGLSRRPSSPLAWRVTTW
jgi:hypothetical protein